MLPASLIDDLRRIPETAASDDLPALVGALAEAQARALARLTTPPATNGNGHDAAEPEQNLAEGNISVGESARRLGVSAAYIYKNAKELPFTIRIGRRLVCSARKLGLWNRARLSR